MAGEIYPELYVHPQSGLTFPWAFWNPNIEGKGDMHLGPDGVTTAEVMLVEWKHLETACQQLLGYSWRDTSSTTPNGSRWIRRVLPWQHPYFNQLWIKSIPSVRGYVPKGNSTTNPEDYFVEGRQGMSAGPGAPNNFGPWSEFALAGLTLQFWRPPYYVMSDAAILDGSGNPQEWMRFTDKDWDSDMQFLTREGCQFDWAPHTGDNPPYNTDDPSRPGPPGSIGTPVGHEKLVKRWYQVPEASLFEALEGDPGLLNGFPANQMFMQTATTNPITGYVITPSATVGNAAHHAFPIKGTVNSPKGGGVRDNVGADRFFGCPMGTLRLDAVKYIKRPLQLPAYLMRIPFFSGSEAVSQQQYDVEFYFDLFDPQRSTFLSTSTVALPASSSVVREAYRGHNLVPWAGDTMYYPIQSQSSVRGSAKKGTPFNYSVMHDLFRSL